MGLQSSKNSDMDCKPAIVCTRKTTYQPQRVGMIAVRIPRPIASDCKTMQKIRVDEESSSFKSTIGFGDGTVHRTEEIDIHNLRRMLSIQSNVDDSSSSSVPVELDMKALIANFAKYSGGDAKQQMQQQGGFVQNDVIDANDNQYYGEDNEYNNNADVGVLSAATIQHGGKSDVTSNIEQLQEIRKFIEDELQKGGKRKRSHKSKKASRQIPNYVSEGTTSNAIVDKSDSVTTNVSQIFKGYRIR